MRLLVPLLLVATPLWAAPAPFLPKKPRMATISDSMPADETARLLEQLAGSGEMEAAVKLLGQMKVRRAAVVLAEMTDVALAARLIDKLRGLKRPAPPGPPDK